MIDRRSFITGLSGGAIAFALGGCAMSMQNVGAISERGPRPDERPHRDPRPAAPGGDRGRREGRPLRGGRVRSGRHAAPGRGDPGCRRGRPGGDPRPERFASPRHSGRPQLHDGASLGRRALPGRGDAPIARAGAPDPAAPVGPRRGRLHGVAVRGASVAHAGRAERGGAGHAGLRAAPVRPGAAEPRGAARGRVHEGHAGAARRPDRARPGGQSHGPADREAECVDSLLDAGQGSEAVARASAGFHALLHARAEPATGSQAARPSAARSCPTDRIASPARRPCGSSPSGAAGSRARTA